MRELFFVDDARCRVTLVAKLYLGWDYGVLFGAFRMKLRTSGKIITFNDPGLGDEGKTNYKICY